MPLSNTHIDLLFLQYTKHYQFNRNTYIPIKQLGYLKKTWNANE
jgi:hypothetical protein